CGPNAREDALGYARQRAGCAPTEIQVLDEQSNVDETNFPATCARPRLRRKDPSQPQCFLSGSSRRRPILAFGEIARVDIFKFKSTVAFRGDRTDWKKCGRETGRGFDRVGFKWYA